MVFCPDDQQRRGKFVEIDRHPILILDLLPIFINLKDAAARVYEHFQIILFPDEVLPQKPGLFVGHGQYHPLPQVVLTLPNRSPDFGSKV